MSSMLEQAIIDATALKEAAIKNAEAAIIEKYAPEVKKAVETLLEQPEEEDPLAADPMGMDPLAAEEPADVDVDLPQAAAPEVVSAVLIFLVNGAICLTR